MPVKWALNVVGTRISCNVFLQKKGPRKGHLILDPQEDVICTEISHTFPFTTQALASL